MPSTVTLYLRRGNEPILSELENRRFDSVAFTDGTLLEDVTFNQLAEAVWNLQSKSSVSTVTLQTKN